MQLLPLTLLIWIIKVKCQPWKTYYYKATSHTKRTSLQGHQQAPLASTLAQGSFVLQNAQEKWEKKRSRLREKKKNDKYLLFLYP